jgi:hypothetical protein
MTSNLKAFQIHERESAKKMKNISFSLFLFVDK